MVKQLTPGEAAPVAVEGLQFDVDETKTRIGRIETAAQQMQVQIGGIEDLLRDIGLSIKHLSADSEFDSGHKESRVNQLTEEEIAYLRQQEAEGKITINHTPVKFTGQNDAGASGSGKTVHSHATLDTEKQPIDPKTEPVGNDNSPHGQPVMGEHNWGSYGATQFSLSIARPKLDFPYFAGENPAGWLRQCEKYFELACVPMDLWVPMATLHCQGKTEHWWRGMRTPAKQLAWSNFCPMVLNRFSHVSSFDDVENFHMLRQTSSVTEYIERFEENMSIVQREHPSLHADYYVKSFVGGLKDGIKHYLKPHKPMTLCDAYWIAKDLERGILAKKSLMNGLPAHTNQYQRPNYNANAPQRLPLPPVGANQQQQRANRPQQPPKNREPRNCWGCHEPWTPQHKFVCKFKRDVNAMAIDPDNWLVVEQEMEEENQF